MIAPYRAAALVVIAAGLAAAPHSSAQSAAPLPREGFRTENGNYVSTASGQGSSAQEAEEKARGAALHGLFSGLGKDGLFAEVFSASPPIGLSFRLVDSSRDGISYKALVVLEIDDESVRIVERGPYLAAAVALVDKAEAASDEAGARRLAAATAETSADLGAALGQYGMSIDTCRSALKLIDALSDPSVFSTKGKRTAPELKKDLAAVLAESLAGVERVKKAEAALAADESSAAAGGVADAALAAADEAQALLDEIAPVLGDVTAYGEERLSPIRDRIGMRRRSLSDSAAALERALASVPKGKDAFASDKMDFAKRRLSTADASLAAAFKTVDREIRDPAFRRAARAAAIRWAFLHTPREYLHVRAYLPFKVATGKSGAESAPFDVAGGFEGAFALGSGGAWVRTLAKTRSTDLRPAAAGGDEFALSQTFDFGIWGRTLFFAGYTWDWMRQVDDASRPKPGAVEVGIGGVYEHGVAAEKYRRADWLLALSYELPYSTSDSRFWYVANAGIEAQVRLGEIALLEASLSKRLDEVSYADYASVLRYSVGFGLRLPPPFAFGAEFSGTYVQPMEGEDPGPALGFEGGRFRFFIQYSI